MSSFEFYGPEQFASCQYDADKFFLLLENTHNAYPLLSRAEKSFRDLSDDTFLYATGAAQALELEVNSLIRELDLDLINPAQQHRLAAVVFQELEAVFAESRMNKTDIKFRWG